MADHIITGRCRINGVPALTGTWNGERCIYVLDWRRKLVVIDSRGSRFARGGITLGMDDEQAGEIVDDLTGMLDAAEQRRKSEGEIRGGMVALFGPSPC